MEGERERWARAKAARSKRKGGSEAKAAARSAGEGAGSVAEVEGGLEVNAAARARGRKRGRRWRCAEPLGERAVVAREASAGGIVLHTHSLSCQPGIDMPMMYRWRSGDEGKEGRKR